MCRRAHGDNGERTTRAYKTERTARRRNEAKNLALPVLSRSELTKQGEMAEWLKAIVLKTIRVERLSRVRIPVSPPRNCEAISAPLKSEVRKKEKINAGDTITFSIRIKIF